MAITFIIERSVSEYFIPRTSTGTRRSRYGSRTSWHTGCSAKSGQNSQASKAKFSSGSWVRSSINCNKKSYKCKLLGICLTIKRLLAFKLIIKKIFEFQNDRQKYIYRKILKMYQWQKTCVVHHTSIILLIWGIRRSIWFSTNKTIAAQTFFRTSRSVSSAKTNKLWKIENTKLRFCTNKIFFKKIQYSFVQQKNVALMLR